MNKENCALNLVDEIILKSVNVMHIYGSLVKCENHKMALINCAEC